MMKLVLVFVCALAVCVNARHLHPHVDAEGDWGKDVEESEQRNLNENVEVDLMRNIKPTRFVPINKAIFFTGYLPCQDGFKRDYMGICREVWD